MSKPKLIKRFPNYDLEIVEYKFKSGYVQYCIIDTKSGKELWGRSYEPLPKDAEYQHTYEEVWIQIGHLMTDMNKALVALDL